MKVVYFLDQVSSPGGIERVVSIKSNYLVKKNVDVVIVTNENRTGTVYYEISNKVRVINLGINYNKSKSLYSYCNLLKAIKHFFRLKKLLLNEKPQISIVTTYNYLHYFIPILKTGKIVREHHSSYLNHDVFSLSRRLRNSIEDFFSRLYDLNIFLSSEESNSKKINNSKVIPNSLKTRNYKSNLIRENTVIFAGRIAPVKGLERLIKVWSLVVNSVPSWRLEIYGDGEEGYVDSLKTLAARILPENSYIFMGATQKIETKMAEAGIFAMTSHSECYPMVLLEAMNNYLPVIAFDCPTGPRNIIINKNTGLLIENGNINDYAEGLKYLIKNEMVRCHLSENAYQKVKDYDEDKILSLYLQELANIGC